MPREWATKSIVSVDSHACSSCAIASAAMTADWRCSCGYFAISRSMRLRASKLSMINRLTCAPVRTARHTLRRNRASAGSYLVGPVVQVVIGARHVPQAASESADLFRIRVFADFRRHHGADRKVGKLGVGVVDDLVRGFRAADRAADHVAGPDLSCLVAVAQRSCALHDKEHLLFAAVAVKRAGALARRYDIV